MIRTNAPRQCHRRHLGWLLWLALLLPLAQSAAIWHGYTHPLHEASRVDEPQAPSNTHCDLCLTAAAVTGGGALLEPHALPVSIAQHEVPRAASTFVRPTDPTPAYRSRAPPLASH